MTPSEFTNVVELSEGVAITNFVAAEHGSAFLDEATLNLMKNSADEHEIIVVHVTPMISEICNNAQLWFVNSEEVKWIHTSLADHDENYQKPDGLVVLLAFMNLD